MDFEAILDRIEAKVAEQGMSARAVSMIATGSGDTIRNWQRARREKGTIPGMNARSITAIAKALGVSAEWLTYGTGAPRTSLAAGFHEPDVAPFFPADAPEQLVLGRVADLLGRGAKHVLYFRSSKDFPGFFVLRGDLLVVGTPARTQDGDIVVATLADMDTGEATTVLRQRFGDLLVPPVGGRIADEHRFVPGILGTVVAILRSTDPSVIPFE